MQLSGVMLFVKDLPRMRAFYSELLCTQPDNSDWTDSYARYSSGGVSFALHAIPEAIAREIEASPAPREAGSVKFILSTAHIPVERARLQALGATILQRPWQNPEEAFDAADPEGNVFGVTRVLPTSSGAAL